MGKVFCLYHRVASSMSANPAAEVCALCDPPPHISFTWLVAHMFFPFLFAHTHSYIFFGGTERLWNSHSLSLNIPERSYLMDEEFKFDLGDEVIIVNVDDCVFGASDSMKKLEGTVASVIGCRYVARGGKAHKCYKLNGNGLLWMWSENNLIAASAPEESDFESILL